MHYDIGYEKPISRVLFRLAAATIIYLGRRLPAGSSDSTRKVTLAGRYPAHCPVELGLSSCIAKTIQAIVSVSHTNAEIIPHMAVRCQKSP